MHKLDISPKIQFLNSGDPLFVNGNMQSFTSQIFLMALSKILKEIITELLKHKHVVNICCHVPIQDESVTDM